MRRAVVFCLVLAACSDGVNTTSPRPSARVDHETVSHQALAHTVRTLAAGRGIVPLPPAPHVRPALARLGQALAFDKILSGNRNISCMTCHLPRFETGDGRSLPIGTNGFGLGPARVAGNSGRIIPRNAPPLFNLHAMPELFLDGRVSVSAGGQYTTPAGAQLTPAMTRVFEFGALSAQPMFPVVNRLEMLSFRGNRLAALSDSDMQAIWKGYMKRLGRIPQYRYMFEEAYPGTRFEDMTFAHASNAIAGFMIANFTFNQSPWDRFLAGDDDALTTDQLLGAQDFLTLKCSICHNGASFSDLQFHDVALAQLGPGEGFAPNPSDDFGRMNATGDPADRYRFRTSPLRNVELTGPYGHAGQFKELRAFIAHYSQSDSALVHYDPSQIDPNLYGTVVNNVNAVLAARDTLLKGVVIPDSVVDRLTTYMSALTDPRARNLRAVTPLRVPSGLPVD
ncbi:MAG TPA: cytochrome c peroxidase [Gemmatimonadaceae bacterium]|nr:cytochrome c peroxidase [Gemmatimonadaceae bacterium]